MRTNPSLGAKHNQLARTGTREKPAQNERAIADAKNQVQPSTTTIHDIPQITQRDFLGPDFSGNIPGRQKRLAMRLKEHSTNGCARFE